MLVTELKREPGENPGWARRCDRGRPLHSSHWPWFSGWEGATGRTIRESEDLSETKKDVSEDKGQTCVICG